MLEALLEVGRVFRGRRVQRGLRWCVAFRVAVVVVRRLVYRRRRWRLGLGGGAALAL